MQLADVAVNMDAISKTLTNFSCEATSATTSAAARV
jgi:hypothetical protein